MFKSRYFLISLLAVLLALSLFPFSAMAITEDEIQSAPEISLPEDDISVTGPETSEVTSQDDSIYCPGLNALPRRGTLKESEELNLPRLTDAELSMVREILNLQTEIMRRRKMYLKPAYIRWIPKNSAATLSM